MFIIISHTYIHYILIHSGEDEEGEDAKTYGARRRWWRGWRGVTRRGRRGVMRGEDGKVTSEAGTKTRRCWIIREMK
jgi:hypothetical protein